MVSGNSVKYEGNLKGFQIKQKGCALDINGSEQSKVLKTFFTSDDD